MNAIRGGYAGWQTEGAHTCAAVRAKAYMTRTSNWRCARSSSDRPAYPSNALTLSQKLVRDAARGGGAATVAMVARPVRDGTSSREDVKFVGPGGSGPRAARAGGTTRGGGRGGEGIELGEVFIQRWMRANDVEEKKEREEGEGTAGQSHAMLLYYDRVIA